ncbi:hypothetical protein [Spirosoma oryzicola]|uniref:hypothetical protein n=1 Tax=Spirosoma oryzicola TaxID=2898794 RepID=UPI001E4EB386|nr:hypothetical protein [Spirosoma oryzicola]UHG92521.1 hypothetical protein LQ777_06340 [Spirosoma oryzicola]
MKKLLLLLVALSGCTTPKSVTLSTSSMNGILDRHNTTVRSLSFSRRVTPSDEANARMRQWVNSYSPIFDLHPLVPIENKNDLLYVGKLPYKRLYDQSGEQINFPPVSFYLTVNNSPDSTKIWVTNLELRGKAGWLPINQYRTTTDDKYKTMWLANIDMALGEMINSIKQRLGQQTALRN